MAAPITVDPAAAAPPYEQIRAQLAGSIREGSLAAGAKLPTVRALAEQLGVAANTVARAFRELEADGLVETRGRNGTVVRWSAEAGTRELEQAAAQYAARAASLGVGAAEARGIIDRALGI
jgi:DNA-binding transcriptional regulator YhcF (GntR family)